MVQRQRLCSQERRQDSDRRSVRDEAGQRTYGIHLANGSSPDHHRARTVAGRHSSQPSNKPPGLLACLVSAGSWLQTSETILANSLESTVLLETPRAKSNLTKFTTGRSSQPLFVLIVLIPFAQRWALVCFLNRRERKNIDRVAVAPSHFCCSPLNASFLPFAAVSIPRHRWKSGSGGGFASRGRPGSLAPTAGNLLCPPSSRRGTLPGGRSTTRPGKRRNEKPPGGFTRYATHSWSPPSVRHVGRGGLDSAHSSLSTSRTMGLTPEMCFYSDILRTPFDCFVHREGTLPEGSLPPFPYRRISKLYAKHRLWLYPAIVFKHARAWPYYRHLRGARRACLYFILTNRLPVSWTTRRHRLFRGHPRSHSGLLTPRPPVKRYRARTTSAFIP